MVKGNRQVVEEGEHLLLPQPPALQEVLGWGLLHASALPGTARWRWIGGVASGQQRLVAGDEGVAGGRWQPAEAAGTRQLDGGFHLAQQRLELGGPALVILLFNERQLAQMV